MSVAIAERSEALRPAVKIANFPTQKAGDFAEACWCTSILRWQEA
jgi:hypothetical protein